MSGKQAKRLRRQEELERAVDAAERRLVEQLERLDDQDAIRAFEDFATAWRSLLKHLFGG